MTDQHFGCTWIEPEEYSYSSGGFQRRAFVRLRANPNAPKALLPDDIGKLRIVRASVADTFFSVPARLRIRGRTVKGFLSVISGDGELSFTPEAGEGESS